MRVAVTGGTGLVGQALVRALHGDDHDVLVLSRRGNAGPGGVRTARWPGAEGGGGTWWRTLEGADAVVHLAGEPIAARRWDTAQKERIRASRTRGTRALVEGMSQLQRPPAVLISASAVGYYGPCGDAVIHEDAPPGRDFLAEVCVAWEAEAARAEALGTRVAVLRLGLVLAAHGGALARMLLPFRLFLGGPAGTGRQWVAWIHLDDAVGLMRWLLTTPDARGPFHATAPQPLTNRDFSRAIGRALGRPSWLPVPAAALRLALGEMAEALLLTGQRAVPARALAGGVGFRYADADAALRAVLGR